MGGGTMGWTCPYCANPAAEAHHCAACRRDPSAPRRICPACKRMTPRREPRCCHCAHLFKNEMAWKIPVVIAGIILATVVTFLLQSIR